MVGGLASGLAPGTVVAQAYVIERPLAEGGMGAVYVATHLATQRKRALKLMHADLAGDAKLRERFAQEALVGAHIASDHVVEVVDAGVDEATGVLFLVMELLDGQDLDAVVRTRGPLAPQMVLRLFEQLCHALGAAHALGIIHRDLKPENLFLANTQRVGGAPMLKILDFGIAKIAAEARTWTRATDTVGTPTWMAPEQTELGRPVGPTADIWALGLIGFFLLSGRCFWRSANSRDGTPVMLLRELTMDAIPPASRRAGELGAVALPAGFDAWFSRCVARDPSQRFQSVEDVLVGLRVVVQGGAVLGDVTLKSSGGETAPTIQSEAAVPPPIPTALAPTFATPPGHTLPQGSMAGTPSPTLARANPRSRGGLWVALVAAVCFAGLGVGGWWAWSQAGPSGEPSAAGGERRSKKKGKKNKKGSAGKSKKAAPAETGEQPARAPEGGGEGGPLYLAVDDVGVVVLRGGASRVVQKLAYGGSSAAVGLDGAVWVSAIEGVYRVDGMASKRISSDHHERIFGISDSRALAVSYKGVHALDGSAWTVTPKKDLGSAKLLKGVALDADGNVVVLGGRSIFERARGGTAWTEVATSLTAGRAFMKELVRSPSGALYASCNEGILIKEAAQWRQSPGDFGIGGVDKLAVAPDGTVAALGSGRTLYVLRPNKPVVSAKPADMGLSARLLRALTIDARGRIWLATEFGLAVVDRDLRLLRHWPPGTLDGVDGKVTALVAIGGGPSRLPEVKTAKLGTVVGKVMRGSSPVGGAEVEICPSPSSFTQSTPCADASFKMSTKTTSDGTFTFTGIPVGTFRFAYRDGGKWEVPFLSTKCCSGLASSDRVDVGVLKLK